MKDQYVKLSLKDVATIDRIVFVAHLNKQRQLLPNVIRDRNSRLKTGRECLTHLVASLWNQVQRNELLDRE